MNERKRDQMVENSTKIISHLLSSLASYASSQPPPPVRTRTVVNTMYIAGVAFMVGIFLLLLSVNLCNRHCWCWHDTSVINRFNRRWLLRHSTHGTANNSSWKNRTPANDDELE